ncbi:MAG: hypothetical protein WBO35_01610 [Candidatus Saccharimonadales bacterium]|jgi:hypothetical protein
MTRISRKDFLLAQAALLVAIGLQAVTWINNGSMSFGPHPLIILSELALAVILGLMIMHPVLSGRRTYRAASFALLGLISLENVTAIAIVLRQLVTNSHTLSGYQLLGSAIAIFLTNIIVFALWYWEIDSPGLSGKRWSRHDRDFLFLQQDKPSEYPKWQPNFVDYLYHSVTNAINFAPADTRPVTRQAKILMGTQALISVTTLALIVARSVSILGQ